MVRNHGTPRPQILSFSAEPPIISSLNYIFFNIRVLYMARIVVVERFGENNRKQSENVKMLRGGCSWSGHASRIFSMNMRKTKKNPLS